MAEEIAADPKYADEGPLGPDDAARERFRAFAREHLGSSRRASDSPTSRGADNGPWNTSVRYHSR